MGLFEKLKSLLGLEESSQEPTDGRDVGITVEREGDERTAGRAGSDAVDHGGDAGTSAEPDADTDAGSATGTGSSAGGGVSASDAAATTGSESDTATATGAAATPDADADESRVPSEAVDVIKGIGPTYAGRLSDAGIETVDDLAAADAADVADRADVPEGRLEEWIERAENRSR